MTLHREYPELKACRDAIDAIDDRLIALLKERSHHVREVGELKRAMGEATNFIRSDREALMLRRIVGAFAGEAFPARAAGAIWRQIIGASTTMEAPLRLAVTDASSLLLAREHFGPCLPCSAMDEASALEAMEENAHTIAVFLEPQDGEAAWWKQLPDIGAYVFACLPFIEQPDACFDQPCFAAARIEPAPSGDDASWLLLEHAMPIGEAGYEVLCSAEGAHLLVADGWHADAPALAALAARHGKNARLRFLGGYAKPFAA